jgi:hypothetical protein
MKHAVRKEIEARTGWFGLRSGFGMMRRTIRADVGAIIRDECGSQVDQKGYRRISEAALTRTSPRGRDSEDALVELLGKTVPPTRREHPRGHDAPPYRRFRHDA